MPLNRYFIRNEYNLADPELYKSADKDDPEALLEGVAMAGLVGVLRQLGDLAEFAAEIFHDLHEEVMATAARGHDLIDRVQQLEAEFPPIEKSLLSQTNHTSFLYNPGFDWHSKVHIDENLVTQGDLPRFVMDNYEECRGPPRLFLLDKFDVAGAGACLKRYTDPSFVKVESADSNTHKPEGQREKRFRKVKRRGSRWKIGDTPEVVPSSHAKLHQLLLEERIEAGAHDPERRVKLKKRALDRFKCNEESRKSYMKKFLDTCLPVHKVVHEISMDLEPSSAESNIPAHSGLEIVIYDTLSPCEEPLERDKLAYPPCSFPEVEKYSINEFNVLTDNEILEVRDKDPEDDDAGKILLMLSREMEEEELAAVDFSRKSGGNVGEYHSDAASETGSFMDALATIDSDVNIDSSNRIKREAHDLKFRQLDSDGSEEQHGPQNTLLDYQSVGNSPVYNDGSMLNKERDGFSCYDTAVCVAESPQEIEGYVAAMSPALDDRHNMSLVIQNYQNYDHVAGDTSENPDEKLMLKPELDGRSLNSVKRRRGFAKTELKWVKRIDEVSCKHSMTSSFSSVEDELQMPDQLSSFSRTNATIDDSSLFGRVQNSSSSVSSQSEELIGKHQQEEEPIGVVDLSMEKKYTEAVLVINRASISSLNNTEPAHIDIKDADMSSPEEQSQNLFPLGDLEHRSGKAETSISDVGDSSLTCQLDVSEKAVPCCVGDHNISPVSTANDGELMDESRASTRTDGGETVESIKRLATGGPGILGSTPVVDHSEIQSPGAPNYSEDCLVESPANKTSELESVEIETGVSLSENMEEIPQKRVVEEAESSLSTESTESSSASPTAYLDLQLEPQLRSRGDTLLNGGLTEAIQKEDTRVSRDEYDGQEVINAGSEFPISPSVHSVSSLSVLEEEKPFTPDHTASATMYVDAVVVTAQEDDINDVKAIADPLSSMIDQPASSCPQLQDENSLSFRVCSYQNEEQSQTLPLNPDTEVEVKDNVSHIADVLYKPDPSTFSHLQDGETCETRSLKVDTEVEVQDGFNHIADVSLFSSIHCGTTAVDDNVRRSLDTASNPFLAPDRQDSFYTADGSDGETGTEPAVNMYQVTQGGELMVEFSQDADNSQPAIAYPSVHQSTHLDPQSQRLEAQMVMLPYSALSQNQPLVSKFSVLTDDNRLESPPTIKPSTSKDPPTSILPDQIQASQNTEIPPQIISPFFPPLGVISDSNPIQLDEMPPPPPLPPMQWRLGKTQQHASSVVLSEAMHSGSGLSAFVLQPVNNHDLRSQESVGPQSWNPFASHPSEISQPKHSKDHLERSVELELLDMVHDKSEQALLKIAQPLDSQLLAAGQGNLQLPDPGLMGQPGRVSSQNEQFTERASASGGRGVITEEIAVQDEKLAYVSAAVEQEWGEASSEFADSSTEEKVIKLETDDQDEKLPNLFPADEQEIIILHQQLDVSLVMEQESDNSARQVQQEIDAQGETLELASSVVELGRAIEASSEHTDSYATETVIMPEIDVQDEKHPDTFAAIDVQDEKHPDISAAGEQEQAILDEQFEGFPLVTEQGNAKLSSEFKEIAVQDEKPELISTEAVQETAIEASLQHTAISDREKVMKPEIDVQDEKHLDIPDASEQSRAVLDEQLGHVSLVTELGTVNPYSHFKEIAVQDEKPQPFSSGVVQERAIEASCEHTDASDEEKVIKPEIDVENDKLQEIAAAEELERVVLDEQFKHVSSITEQGAATNPSSQSKQGIAVQDEKLMHIPSAVELERDTEIPTKHTNALNTKEVMNPETDGLNDKLSDISTALEHERVTNDERLEPLSSAKEQGTVNTSSQSNVPLTTQQGLGHLTQPAGEQERVICGEQLEHVSSAMEQGTFNPSSQSKVPLTTQQGHVAQPGFIAPEDQEAWSTNAFATNEPGNGNANPQKKVPRPRNPLIDAVVAVDRSKLRKVGEIAKTQEKSRAKEREQNLPQLRKVGERIKPRDGSKTEDNVRNLPRLRKVEERMRLKDIPKSEGKQLSIPQLRKVGDKVKSSGEGKSEARGQSLPQLRKVGGRVKHQDRARSEEREQSLPRLRKVGERVRPQDESKSEEVKKQNLPALRKVGERGEFQNESTYEEREQGLSSLPKLEQKIKEQAGPSADDRDSLMEQIRSKTFNLKPAVTTRTSIPGPQTNLKVAAILQKANIIRQAMVGSDEENSDGWSDN